MKTVEANKDTLNRVHWHKCPECKTRYACFCVLKEWYKVDCSSCGAFLLESYSK